MKPVLSWLFLLSGVIGLLISLALGYRATPSGYELDLLGSVLSVLQISLGVGLLKERRWARWLALGPCLLMLAVGVVLPILVIPFGESLLQLAYVSGILSRDLEGTIVGITGIQGAVIVFSILGAVIGYWGLKYLRADASEEASLLNRRLPLASPKSLVASVAVWICFVYVAGISIVVEWRHVPGFLRTDTMRAREQSADERRQAELTERIAFSADGSRLVVAPTGTSPQEYFLLDLDSGSLSRTAWEGVYLTRQTILATILAPDGLSIFTQGYLMSLLSGEAIRPPLGEHLGFYTPSRVLLYDRNARALNLVDLTADSVVYSIDVAAVQRGEPAEPEARGWTKFSQAWSPDRAHYAWLERDGTLSVLSLDDGSVRRAQCGRCTYGSSMHFSLNGETLLFPDRVSRSDDVQSTGLMFDIQQLQEQTFRYGARLIDASYREQFVVTWNKTRRTLIYRDLSTEGEHVWGLSFPADTVSAFIRGDMLFATIVSPDSGQARNFSGVFQRPQEATDITLVEIAGAALGSGSHEFSPDGRFVAYAAGGRIDLVDVPSAIRGEPVNWSIDLTIDDRWVRTPLNYPSNAIRVAWSENTRN